MKTDQSKQQEPSAETESPEPILGPSPAPAEKKSFSTRVLEEGGVQQGEQTSRKALMKQFRRAKDIPAEPETRYTPALDQGLSQEQIRHRLRVGRLYSRTSSSTT